MDEHKIEVTNTEPVMVKQYPVPIHTEKTNKEDVERMSQDIYYYIELFQNTTILYEIWVLSW